MGASGTGELALRGPRRRPGALIALMALIAAAVAVGLAGTTPATAATTTVQAGQQNGGAAPTDQFNAAAITIAAGDTVHWAWFSNPFGHTVVSYDQTGGVPNWQTPSPLTGSGQSYDHTFMTGGVFTYYCSIHALRTDADPVNIDSNIALGKMVGKVTVASSVGGVAALPDAAELAANSRSGGGPAWGGWSMAAMAAAGATVAAAAYAAMRRARGRRVGIAEEVHD